MAYIRLGLCGLVLWLLAVRAEAVVSPASQPAADDNGVIQLNLPQNVELKLLIEYVSKRLNLNIIYDESIGQTKVSISGPMRLRKEELLGLFRSVLKMAGLELVDTAQPDWKTIGKDVTVRFVPLRNAGAAELAKKVAAILEEREKVSGGAGRISRNFSPGVVGRGVMNMQAASSADVTVLADAKANQIIVVATDGAMAGAVKLIESLDVAPGLETRLFRLRHIEAKRIDNLMKGRTASDSTYSSIIDESSGLLMVTGTALVLRQVETLIKELDVESDSNRSNIQFYKLMNTTATEVLQTIQSLQTGQPVTAEAKSTLRSLPNAPAPTLYTGPNAPSLPGTGELPSPPAYRATPARSESGTPASQPSGEATSVVSALSQNAVVTADQNTNTIIVVAPPDVQRVYRQLILTLDKRRPQVLVEVTLVTLNTSNDFSLGVEFSSIHIGGTDRLFFSSFGLSTIDPTTGKVSLNPSTGLNAAVLNSDDFSMVVQALATSSRAKVVAAPKVLMNDNATGMLASISEEPYTSVNASNTVSTTSFAGYASAGTTVTVTPHISEGDYLQMKYAVVLNSFTGKSTDPNIPPPRQTDSVSSEVTVPNGYAVIVGGLTRKNISSGDSRVPGVGDIPILKYLFGKYDDKDSKETLFVFIRPVILKDEQFEDLKFLSDQDIKLSEQPSNLPLSEPELMY